MAPYSTKVAAIVPAAGIGSRMKSDIAKQYLTINDKTILELTLEKLLDCAKVEKIVVVLHPDDRLFSTLTISKNSRISTVIGGKERADSVLAGLKYLAKLSYDWVLVHDAARPCVALSDIDKLIEHCTMINVGGILATKVRDTMKRSDEQQTVVATEDRTHLWHALTPQLFKFNELFAALNGALEQQLTITDEASAVQWFGGVCQLIESSALNIKITQPEDLALARLIILAQQE